MDRGGPRHRRRDRPGIVRVVASRYAATPDAERVVAAADGAIQSRLEVARASLNARNYRAAAAYAAEVLALNPAHPEAASIRDASQAMLERFDAAMAAAQKHLAIGDVQSAAQALETARAIDATAPAIVELSSRLSDEVRRRDARAQAAHHRAPSRNDTRDTVRAGAARDTPGASADSSAADSSAADSSAADNSAADSSAAVSNREREHAATHVERSGCGSADPDPANHGSADHSRTNGAAAWRCRDTGTSCAAPRANAASGS